MRFYRPGQVGTPMARRREPALAGAERLRTRRGTGVAAEPRAPREPASARVPRRRHCRDPSDGRAGRLPPPPRARSHGRLRLSLASGSACESTPDPSATLATGACSSVEEQRPSKPPVGGSNPPRRIPAPRAMPIDQEGVVAHESTARVLADRRASARHRRGGGRAGSWLADGRLADDRLDRPAGE